MSFRSRRRLLQIALWKLAARALSALEVASEVGLVVALFLPGLAGGVLLLAMSWGGTMKPDTLMAVSLGLGAATAVVTILLNLIVPPVRERFDRKWHVFRLINQLP